MKLRTRYKSLIDVWATKHDLDPLLVEAVVVQESGGNTDFFRFDPTYWNRWMKGRPESQGMNPRRVSSCYGLMGVHYARVLHKPLTVHAPCPEVLFMPEVGLDVGCDFLAQQLTWAGSLPASDATTMVPESIALAAYHGGRGGNDPNKNMPLRNGAYARSVLGIRAALLKEYAQ